MEEDWNLWLIGGGFVIGLSLGALVQRSRFCLVAAVSNLALMRDYRQLHAFLAAVVVGTLGTLLLELGDWAPIAQSSYRNANLDWLGAGLGGLAFGFGAMLAGGCAARTLVRAAEGNLGSIIALLGFALGGMAALYGVLEPVHGWLRQQTAVALPGGDGGLGNLVGVPGWLPQLLIVLAALAGIAVFGRTSRSPGLVAVGAAVGLLVVAGWWVTGYLAQDEFDPKAPASLSIAGPLARTATYLTSPISPAPSFGIALIPGILLGAAAAALLGREFRWTAPAAGHVGQVLVGGILMGVGAMFAGGCNIGNGLTGVSTCSAEALLALGFIVMGMLLGLSWLSRDEPTSRHSGAVLSSGPT